MIDKIRIATYFSKMYLLLDTRNLCVIGGLEDGKNTKIVRALEEQDAEGDDTDGLDQRDRLEDEDEETTKVPPGFLSPSVREYLELGRSIPGIYCYHI